MNAFLRTTLREIVLLNIKVTHFKESSAKWMKLGIRMILFVLIKKKFWMRIILSGEVDSGKNKEPAYLGEATIVSP